MTRKIKVHVCAEIRRERRCSSRAYAHTYHFRRTICIAPELLELPERFRWAILLHELGHLGLAEPHTEQQADAAGAIIGKVPILRADHGTARNLETVHPRDVARARSVVHRFVSWPT